MILTTTPTIEGKPAVKYLGLVSGDAILGANIFRDFFASIRDIVGGRSASYEAELRKAKDIAIGEMREQARNLGANAIVGKRLERLGKRFNGQRGAHRFGRRTNRGYPRTAVVCALQSR